MKENLKKAQLLFISKSRKIYSYLQWRLGVLGDYSQEIVLRFFYSVFSSYSRTISNGVQDIPIKRIAIYVIYPINGVQQSHINTIKALAGAQYSVVVVSNLKLSIDSRTQVCNACWRLIERPNFGYDFGAFRDGVTFATPYFTNLENLVFLNDSAWFPLPGPKSWLTQIQEKEEDFVGAVTNFSVEAPDLSSWRDFRWSYDPSIENFHYCSFALSFKHRAFSSQAFANFWQSLRITNDKIRTVERGEIGLSQALLRAGLSHACTMDVRNLDCCLRTMKYPELLSFVKDLVIPEEPELLRFKLAVIAASEYLVEPERSETLRQAGLTIIARTGVAYAIPRYAYENLGSSFLKKSPLKSNDDARKIILQLTSELEGSEGEVIHSEASALVGRANE